MKLPNLSKLKRAPKPQAKSRQGLKVPGFAEDLYRDMRDRRLLLPALLLVVAIVAVPVALSATKDAPPPPLSVASPEGAEAVAPAVLTEQPVGVRDYRERLDELKSKNPFAAPAGSTDDSVEAADITTPAGEPTGPDGAGAPPASSGAPPADGDNPTTSAAGGDEPQSKTNRQVLVLAPRIDVVAGRAGDAREMHDVEFGGLLPTKRRAPIAMFIGVSGKLTHAQFAVSGNVSHSKGEGACRPAPRDCEFLKLGVGKKRSFTYGPNDVRYTIKITDIRQVVTDRRKVG